MQPILHIEFIDERCRYLVIYVSDRIRDSILRYYLKNAICQRIKRSGSSADIMIMTSKKLFDINAVQNQTKQKIISFALKPFIFFSFWNHWYILYMLALFYNESPINFPQLFFIKSEHLQFFNILHSSIEFELFFLFSIKMEMFVFPERRANQESCTEWNTQNKLRNKLNGKPQKYSKFETRNNPKLNNIRLIAHVTL